MFYACKRNHCGTVILATGHLGALAIQKKITLDTANPTMKGHGRDDGDTEEICYNVAIKRILNYFFYERDPEDTQQAGLMVLLK